MNPNTKRHLNALIKAAEFLIERGPIVCTQVGKCYSYKNTSKTVMTSSEIYDILNKHINLIQVYVHVKAYLIENTGSQIPALLDTISSMINKESIINMHTEERLQDIFSDALQFLDTARDKS